MKIWKRLFCLLLSLVLIFSMVSTAFAQTSKQSPNKPNYEFYVPMGTSITGGYGLPGARYGSVTPPDGVFLNQYTYASLVAEEFGIEGHFSGALLGTRTMEYRMLLEDDYYETDDYNEFWVQANCQNGLEQLKKKAPEYKENLKKADLISLEIGSNDISAFATASMMDYLKEQAKGTEYEDDVLGMLESIVEDNGTSSDTLLSLVSIGTLFEDYGDLIERLTGYFQKGMEDFKTNFGPVIKDIRAVNPTADLFVFGCYNPIGYMLTHEITANENGFVDMKNLMLSTGEYLSLSEEQIAYFFNLINEFVIGEQNVYIQYSCPQRNEYTYVDTMGIDLTGSLDGTHPYVPGHAYLADHLIDAIYSLYPCQHRHLTTYNAVTPTAILPLGYTGNTYCIDCGALISMGRIITYTEYQRQQQQGNIPDVDAYEEEIDPIEQPPAGEPLSHDGYDVLAFTSDIHNKTGNVSATRLGNWFDSVETQIGAIDFFGANGDYGDGNGSANGDAYWNLVKTVVDTVKTAQNNYEKQNYPFEWVLTTGNHEQENGNYNNTTNTVKNDIKMTGEAEVPVGANYKVYCFGATQSSYAFDDSEITKLDNYLNDVPSDCPVFVLSHFPLHEQGSRSIDGEEKVIEVLNEHPNVIFIWGHNHTDANNSENHYDKVFTENIDGTSINFTYASAGCMSDSENNAGSAAVKGKGLVVKVADDELNDNNYPKITMQYVDAYANASSIIYSVDITGNGTKEAEATEIEVGYAYDKVNSPENNGQYIIAYKDGDKYIALDLTKCGGYTNKNSYRYSGYKGTAVTVDDTDGLKVTGGVTSDMIWQFEKVDNKWAIRNVLTGKYLNADYVDGMKSGTKDGRLYLANAQDTWSLSGSQLTSTAAKKTLAFDKEADIDGPYTGAKDFFTVRSNGDNMVFFQVTDNPIEMGTPTPDEETVVVNLDEKELVIAYANRALGVSANDGYKNDSNYTFSGLNAKTISFDEEGKVNASGLSNDILWKFEKVAADTYRIKNVYTGQYLGSSYTETTSGSGRWSQVTGADGKLFLTNSNSYTWTYKGSVLTSVQSKKELSFETPETVSGEYEGSLYFFTVRSDGSAIKMYLPEGNVSDPAETEMLGKCTAWKQTNIGDGTFCLTVNGYAVGLDAGKGIVTRQISNESQITELGTRFQWKVKATDTGYSFENVGNAGYYLGAYTESNILTTKASLSVGTTPYSWQFSNNRLSTSVKARGILNLSFSNTYYLSCANGTLSLAIGSISNSVKLYQSVKIADTHTGVKESVIPATCTEAGTRTIKCSDCGASITIAIPAAGHIDGNDDSFCDICGYAMEGNTPEPVTPGTQEGETTTYSVTVDGSIIGYYAEGTEVQLKAGTKTGKKFKEWVINGIDTAELTLANNPLTITVGTGNITATSTWNDQHKVTVDGKTSYHLTGEKVTIDAGTKENARFVSWTVTAPSRGDKPTDMVLTDITTTFTMPDNDLTITSSWEKTTHTVKFVSNGGTSYDSIEVVDGYVLSLNSYRPTKSGYTFQRWNLDADLTQSAGNSVNVTSDITLYASYTSNGFLGIGENSFSSAASSLFSGITSFFNSLFRW